MPDQTMKKKPQKISRRKFLISTALGGAVTGTLGFPYISRVQAAKPVKLTIQTAWEGGTLGYVQFRKFCNNIRKMSNGLLEIEGYPAGTVVETFEMFDAVKARIFDGMHCFDAYWVSKIPVAAFLSSYPFGLDRPDQWETWYNALGGREFAREAFAKHNMHHIGPIQQGGNLIHSKVPIRSFADFKGKKIKCFDGITADFFKAIGANPIPLPGKDIHPTIDRDDIDALYFGGTAINANSRYGDTAKYIIADTPAAARLHRQVNIMSLAINKRTWNMISKPLQLLLEAAVAQYSYHQYSAFQKADMEAFENLKNEQGVEIIRLEESEIEKFKRFAPAMWVKWAKKSNLARKAFESQLAFLKSNNLIYITDEGLVDLDGKKLNY